MRPFVTGDFYLLVPLTASSFDWCAWQLHREDLGAGVAVFFRRHRCPFPGMAVALRQIDPAAEYEVSLSPGYMEGPRRRMCGKDLLRLHISIPDAPGSLVLRYSRAGPAPA